MRTVTGYVLPIIGIILSFFMIKYRERLGDMIGDADWMNKLGGVYNMIMIIAVILFFWCIAELTGTTTILFRPLLYVLPGMSPGARSTPDDIPVEF